MHRHIHAHAVLVDAGNVHDLSSMDFVFVCIDDGPSAGSSRSHCRWRASRSSMSGLASNSSRNSRRSRVSFARRARRPGITRTSPEAPLRGCTARRRLPLERAGCRSQHAERSIGGRTLEADLRLLRGPRKGAPQRLRRQRKPPPERRGGVSASKSLKPAFVEFVRTSSNPVCSTCRWNTRHVCTSARAAAVTGRHAARAASEARLEAGLQRRGDLASPSIGNWSFPASLTTGSATARSAGECGGLALKSTSTVRLNADCSARPFRRQRAAVGRTRPTSRRSAVRGWRWFRR